MIALLSRFSKKKRKEPSGQYVVMVDDNFHYQDESERYQLGTFNTLEEAITACKEIVDKFLIDSHAGDMWKNCSFWSKGEAHNLYTYYVLFGEDPWIASGQLQDHPPFSAWKYAEQRSIEICGE